MQLNPPLHSSTKKNFALISFLLVLILIAGCGGSGSSGSPASPQAGTTSVQINFGDAPADWIVAFSMNMSSMTLINSGGTTVSVASGPMQMEMRHLMGTMQPVAMINIPQGTYSMATIAISSEAVTYMDPVSKLLVQQTMPGMTKTFNFNPPVTVGTMPETMNFDLDLSQSFSGAAGHIAFNPVFNMTTGMPGGGQGTQSGGMEHMMGGVSGISGSSFTMSMMQGLPTVTVMTNSNTHFDHISGMGSMGMGMLVEVNATMQADGSLMATWVSSVLPGMSGGLMAEGLVNSITGNPPSQFTIICDNGAGTSMMSSYLGTALQINLTSTTQYGFDANGVDLSNLPFTPAFNSSTLAKGQRVDPDSTGGMMMGGMGGGMMSGAINATQVTLEQQGLSGTVSSYADGSPASFVLNLPSDSAFTSLTGAGTVMVFQQPGTQLSGSSSVTNNAGVQVRGLLFFDAGTYKMVAARIVVH